MYGEDDYYPPDDVHEGPGKTGITERGTLYREDTSPSPPPERRPPPVYTPPGYREDSISPPIPTGITERGTLYREDTSPSPPPLRRNRRVEPPAPSPPPPMRTRMRHESPPSPPAIPRRRTVSQRSKSFESISPSPSPPPPSPPLQQVVGKLKQKLRRPPSPLDQMNTPPVLRHTRGPTPSPPSSGELTPSPPDLSHMRGGASPVSPAPMYPSSPRGPDSPLESLTPSPPPPERERLRPVSPPSPPRLRRGRPAEPTSPAYSQEAGVPPRLRRSSRNVSSPEEEVHYTRSHRGQPPSPPTLGRAIMQPQSPPPMAETRARHKKGSGRSKKHKRR